jgi:hypothetical protein
VACAVEASARAPAGKTIRLRDKDNLNFVAKQGCAVCGRQPSTGGRPMGYGRPSGGRLGYPTPGADQPEPGARSFAQRGEDGVPGTIFAAERNRQRRPLLSWRMVKPQAPGSGLIVWRPRRLGGRAGFSLGPLPGNATPPAPVVRARLQNVKATDETATKAVLSRLPHQANACETFARRYESRETPAGRNRADRRRICVRCSYLRL